MAAEFTITDEMRAVIGVESEPYTAEYTTTAIRAFARGVGYTDRVYYDVATAQAAGYASLPAPPSFLGVAVYDPDNVDAIGFPKVKGPRLNHGLPNLLDGGTEIVYERIPVAGDTLHCTSQVADLEVKESKGLGKMLIVSNKQIFRDGDGTTVFTVNAQAIWY